MASIEAINPASAISPLIGQRPNPWFNALSALVVIVGVIYAGYHLASDLSVVRDTRVYPFILLGIALLIALGFEFVNGFHDTANAVATVIYTHSLPPNLAVIWSGFFNFLGVLVSSGAVAFGIVSLLPVAHSARFHRPCRRPVLAASNPVVGRQSGRAMPRRQDRALPRSQRHRRNTDRAPREYPGVARIPGTGAVLPSTPSVACVASRANFRDPLPG